ncbi:MAG: hypothetical protein ACOZQL_27310 [Myxococcota bacterium]
MSRQVLVEELRRLPFVCSVDLDQIYLVRPSRVAGVWERMEVIRSSDGELLTVYGAVAAVSLPRLQWRGLILVFEIPEVCVDGARVWFDSKKEFRSWVDRLIEIAGGLVSERAESVGQRLLEKTQAARTAADDAWQLSPELGACSPEDAAKRICGRLSAEAAAAFARLEASKALVGFMLPNEHRAALAALVHAGDAEFLQLGQAGGIRPLLPQLPAGHWSHLIEISDAAMCRLRILVDRIVRAHGTDPKPPATDERG